MKDSEILSVIRDDLDGLVSTYENMAPAMQGTVSPYTLEQVKQEAATLRKYAAIAKAIEKFDVAVLYRVLGDQHQCDHEGVMCIVSRQAVEEAREILRSSAPQFQEEGKTDENNG